MRAFPRGAAIVAACVILLATGVGPASSADGLWYFEQMGVDTAHADGITGEGVTIAVIDGPINTDVPTLKDANIEVREDSFCTTGLDSTDILPARSTEIGGQFDASHGTNVASFIAGTGDGYGGQSGVKGVAPGATLLYYTAWTGDPTEGDGSSIYCYTDDFGEDQIANNVEFAVGDAMNEAMDSGADLISVSALLTPSSSSSMYEAYLRAIREGVVVLGGMSNTTAIEFNGGWPGQANGAVGVQAADSSGSIQTTDGQPNFNAKTTVIAPGVGLLLQGEVGGSWESQQIGSGTSFATPMVAGFLALVKQKYPETTGNQLIQTLIHNTGGEDHELYYAPDDTIGYGGVSASHMLRVDPSQYPDENPLITDNADYTPTPGEFAATPDSSGEATDPTGNDEPDQGAGAIDLAPIVIGFLIGVVLLVGVIAIVVVLAVRKSKKNSFNRNKG